MMDTLALTRFSLRVLSIFFCLYSPWTLYILENILEYREYFCHSAGRRRQKIAPNRRLSPQNRPGSLKTQRFQPASTQNLLLRGKRAVLGSSSQEVVDATVVTPRIFANILRIEVNHGQGAEEKLYILAKKPATASIFSRIFANTKVRWTAYILKKIRE